MEIHTEIATGEEKTERAASSPTVIGCGESSRGVCPICGTPLRGRQRSACSDKCRAAKSRRAKIPVKAEVFRAMVKALAKEAGMTAEDFA